MSLLEGLVALVILGVSAVSYLDVFRGGIESAQRSREWERMVQVAQSTMEASLLGDALQAQQAVVVPDTAVRPVVTIEPWREGVSQVVVTVRSPSGQSFVLRRLVKQ